MKKSKKILSIIMIICCIITIIPTASAQAATLKVSKEKLKADIAKYSVSVPVNDQVQRFAIKKEEIKKIDVKSTRYNSAKTKATVKSVVYIDRDVATVRGNVTSTYKYNTSKKKWTLSSVKYSKTKISKFNAVGTWSGTYVANQGKTKAVVSIPQATADGFFNNAVFSFSAVPTNPTVPSGSYSIIGGYDLSTGLINFTPGEWIDQPDDYSMLEFMAYIDLVHKRIKGFNYLLELVKA